MATQNDNQFPVVVIGAGLAGLSAAAHLAERGVAPVLLEADSIWPGGRLSGGEAEIFEYDGRCWSFKPDHGVHALWGGYVNMKALLERFTETTLQVSDGEEWINRWGREVRRMEAGNAIRSRWIPAPLHHMQLLLHPQIWANIQPWDFLSLPGVLLSIMLTVGMDPIKEQRALDGLMMKEYFRGWTPNLRATFTGLGANLLAAPVDQISLTGFIAAMRFYTMLRADSWQMTYLPADSHTALIQPLADHISREGGQFFEGVTATCLEPTETGWRVVVEDSARQGYRSLQAEHVVLAINAPAAKRLLHTSPALAERASEMVFPEGLRNAVVRLWFDATPRTGTMGGMFTGDFLPDNFFWLHRLYDDYREWHAAGGSAIELHFYEDSLLDQPDRNLIVNAVTDVQRAFPRLHGHFVHGSVRRNSKVHTNFRVPTAESLHVETGWPQLHAAGDWIGHDTPSLWMERATTTGIAAANAVLEAKSLELYPLLYPRTPEIGVRALSAILQGGRRVFSPLLRLRRR